MLNTACGQVQSAEMLLLEVGCDVAGLDRATCGHSPIHVAARRGHDGFIEVLARKECDPNSRGRRRLSAAHHLAATRGRAGIMEVLARAECDLKARAATTRAIHTAAREGHRAG